MRYRHPLRLRALSAVLSATLAVAVVSLGLSADPAGAATSKSTHSTTSKSTHSTTSKSTHSTGTTAPLTGVAAARAQLAASIALRQAALRRVLTATAQSKTIIPANQTVLSAALTQALIGMTSLAAQVKTDTTQADVTADQTEMVQGYRVLALQVPVADMVLAADLTSNIEAQLVARGPAVQKLLAPAANKGSPVPASINAAYTEFERQLTAAQSATAGVSTSLLSLLPESYPANEGVLTSAQTDLVNARHDLGVTITDLDTIITYFHR